MRLTLINYLTAECESVPRWFQPYMASANTPKPFGVIRFGSLMPSVQGPGLFRTVEIWPYVTDDNFLDLDAAIKELRTLLHKEVLTTESGQRFELEFVWETDDFYDDDLKALTRRLDFRVPQVGLL